MSHKFKPFNIATIRISAELLISTLIMRHAIAGPSAAGMLLSSLQG